MPYLHEMKTLTTITIAAILNFYSLAQADAVSLETLRAIDACTFEAVGQKMRMTDEKIEALKAEKPAVRFSAETPLEYFQAAAFKFWKFMPDFFQNSFNPLTGEIFLSTEAERYKAPRSAADSLAHEYTHFFQYIHAGKDPYFTATETMDESEVEAIRVQDWYRSTKPCGI